jgi:Tfp pilus assembly protein FimT
MIKNIFQKNQGYFLMDVLVVSGIVVLLATISIPYLKKYQPNLKLNAAARDLTTNLRYAQQLTVTEQVAYSVAFDLNNDSYQILKLGDPNTVIKNVSFDSDVNFQQITGLSDNQAIFNFYGGVSESGQVILVNINNKTAVINIKPSGYIQLEQ